jgi:dihydrofolate synthase/folylpolyglutamate synthase
LAARTWPIAPRVLIAGSLYLAGDVLRENRTPPD